MNIDTIDGGVQDWRVRLPEDDAALPPVSDDKVVFGSLR